MNSKTEKATKEQLKAQSYDRHLTVNANAGTGKTRVLVHRYLNILLGLDPLKTEIEPQDIVAITFTRKAASEMLLKITEKIEKELRASQKQELSARLEEIRENLTYASISTIHSFCSKLLRDYPIEAGINPAFVELSQPEKLSFQDLSITEVFEDWLQSDIDAKRLSFKELLNILPENNLRNLLKLLLNKRVAIKNLIEIFSKSNDEILKKRDEYLNNYALPSIEKAIFELQKFFTFYDSQSLKANNKIKFDEDYEQLSDFANELKAKSKASNLSDLIRKTGEIILLFFTKSFTIRAVFQVDEKFSLEDIIGEAASAVNSFQGLLDALEYEEKDIELIEAIRTVIKVYLDLEQSIKQRKDELGALDFDDMILLAHKLLENKEISQKVAKKIKYLLVDEFQDTDAFQYSIMKNLIGDFAGFEQNNNLFIVGDAKQSIYGFRNADVRIFNRAREDIRAINRKKIENRELDDYFLSPEGHIISDSEREREGDLQLTATFRMQPNICTFVNYVCSNIFGDKSNSYDVEYSDLVCAKNAEEFFESENKNQFGTVRFLCSFQERSNDSSQSVSALIEKRLAEIEELENKGDGDSEDEDENILEEQSDLEFLEEAELVARFIKNAVEGESDLLLEDKGKKRKPEYRDFAVLSRAKASFEPLVFYCLKYEIPHILHSGSGFFNNQEIIDVHSFLSFLNNQNDDLSFASILKSPFFSFSDAFLFELASGSKARAPLWEIFKKRFSEPNGSRTQIEKRAFSIISNLISIAPNYSLSQLINEILAQTDYWGTLEKSPAAAQKRINIEKLLSFARAFQSRGFRTLNHFVEELDFLIENSIDDSAQVSLTDENAVNMMTIHASKGLEFPIVILLNANRKPNASSSFQLDDEFGLSFKIPVVQSAVIREVETPLSFIIKRNNRQAEDAEDKRVLYVALTRAKEHLVISANLVLKKAGGIAKAAGMLKLITSGLGIEPDFYLENDSLTLNENLALLIKDDIKKMDYELNINFIKNIELFEGKSKVLKDSEEERVFLLNQVESAAQNRIFSASKLMVRDLDSFKYAERYLLGLPDEEQDDFLSSCSTKEDGEEEIIGSRAGTLIHNVLESISFWLKENGYLNETAFTEAVDTVLENSSVINQEKIKERILTELKKLSASPLIQKFAKNIPNAKSELEISVPFEKDFLLGKIDLLIQNESKEYEIWDWKTNRVDGEDEIQALKSHYEAQMKFYAYLISLLYPEQSEYKARLLFTRLANEGAKDSDWTSEFIWSKNELKEYENELITKIREIEIFPKSGV